MFLFYNRFSHSSTAKADLTGEGRQTAFGSWQSRREERAEAADGGQGEDDFLTSLHFETSNLEQEKFKKARRGVKLEGNGPVATQHRLSNRTPDGGLRLDGRLAARLGGT